MGVFNEPGPLLLIGLAILLLFGAAAIPRLARSLGRAKGEFMKAKGDFDGEVAAGASSVNAPQNPSEIQIRKAAREVGIPEAGLPLDEVKRQLNQRLS